MNKIIINALIGAAGCLAVSGSAFASSVSYYLNQSNMANIFPSGNDYLQVTIDDHGMPDNKLYFTVTPLDPLISIIGSNFNIDKFAFSAPLSDLSFVKSTHDRSSGRSSGKDKGFSTFGKFDSNTGGDSSNTNSLMFSLKAGDNTIESYMNTLSSGVSFFTAQISGFNIGCGNDDADDDNSSSNRSSHHHHHSSGSHHSHESSCGNVASALFGGSTLVQPTTSTVPAPAAVWLFGSGLLGLIGVGRRRNIRK